MNKIHDSVIVSWDFSQGPGVLIIGGKRINQSIDIINAYEGEEAKKIRDMLIEQKVKQ